MLMACMHGSIQSSILWTCMIDVFVIVNRVMINETSCLTNKDLIYFKTSKLIIINILWRYSKKNNTTNLNREFKFDVI